MIGNMVWYEIYQFSWTSPPSPKPMRPIGPPSHILFYFIFNYDKLLIKTIERNGKKKRKKKRKINII